MKHPAWIPLLTAAAALLLFGACAPETGIPIAEAEPVVLEEPVMITEEFNNYSGIPADDPWVIRNGNSWYYCRSYRGGIWVERLSSPAAVGRSPGTMVFDGTAPGYLSIWAPELHYIDGCWYLYAAMSEGDGSNEKHRMYVLKCTGDDPTGPFEMVGKLSDSTDCWAIDGTVFEWKGSLYTIWSGWPGEVNGVQNLYIAKMSDPCTISSERVLISTPDSWDSLTADPAVNEGPAVLVGEDSIRCLYSGNGSWTDDYAIGVLTFRGDDPLDASCWVKSGEPLAAKHGGFYGPGHCSITEDAGGNLFLVLHANLASGTGWSGRSLRLLPLSIEGDTLTVPSRLPDRVTVAGFAE